MRSLTQIWTGMSAFWLLISSAVSTVLRVQEFPVAAAAIAEQCGYGDLR
jgi:hypothetical protein